VADPQPTQRISVVIRNVAWVGIVAHAGFIPMFWLLGQPRLALFNILSVVTWVAAAVANRRGMSTLAMWMLTLEVAAHAVLAVMTLGWASGFQYYLVPLIPFVMFNDRLSMPRAVVISAGVFMTFLGLRVLAPEGSLPTLFAQAQSYANIAIPFLALALVSVYFRMASITAERHMEKMAETDALTGLLNRRRMSERLNEEQARFAAGGKPFCVILADVDHFKLIAEGLRGRDSASRWGGEEFLMLLPETTIEGARDVAGRLRSAAETRLFELAGLKQRVTLTFGVAPYGTGRSLEDCIKAADEAMYEGKKSGRNTVVGAGA
jgi:GGDEF domain-containing protein